MPSKLNIGFRKAAARERSKAPLWFLAGAAVLLALNAWAADPWQKSYKQWDAQDLRRILNDSPWSKIVEIEHREPKHGMDALKGAPALAGEDEENEQDEKDDDRGRGDKGKKKDEVKFLVRWVSSRTLREASVRGQVLQGKIAEADADKHLPPPPDDYELAVVGKDMSAFREADESKLKDRAFLVARQSKQKVKASQVEIVRAADGKRINAIVFHFPKTNAAGQALVSSEEKELQFVSRTGALEIKTSFDAQKMVDQQGMDL